MIFRPRGPINILGFKLLGLMPKRKSDLARKIGETVENELISHKDIQEIINTPEVHGDIMASILKVIDKFIDTIFSSWSGESIFSFISSFIQRYVSRWIRNFLFYFIKH